MAAPSLRRSVSVLGRAQPDDGDENADDVTEAFFLSDDSGDDQASDFEDDDEDDNDGVGDHGKSAAHMSPPSQKRKEKERSASKATGLFDLSSQAALTTNSSRSTDPLLADGNADDWQTGIPGSTSTHRCACVLIMAHAHVLFYFSCVCERVVRGMADLRASV
jgi:hypothetical protein